MMKHIAVFGMGYVGCVTAGCLSRDGHHVVGVDIDRDKLAAINAGVAPISEPGLEKLIEIQVRDGRLRATNDIIAAVRDSEMALVSVGTPSASDGRVETRAVERVVQAIGRALRGTRHEYTIAIRSTLLPGILEERLQPALEESAERTVGNGIHLCNNPEFLREATAIRDYDEPPFILVGAAKSADAEPVLDLYRNIDAPRFVTDTRTAVLVKYACNVFHAMKIGFANEIGTLARAFAADGHEVMRLLCQDTRLNISPAYLHPGFAFGGSCLPKDVRALTHFAQQQGIRCDLLGGILPSNEAHIGRALTRVQDTASRRIGLVGLSFKAGTDDLRESPHVILAEMLLQRGYDLRIYDPGVRVARMMGSNESYVERHLPHLAAFLVDDPHVLYRHSELLVMASDVANGLDWTGRFSGEVIDLRRDLVVGCPPTVVGAT